MGGFQLGRYGFRERIDFGTDANVLLTYRTSVALWAIGLGIQLEQVGRVLEQSEQNNWIIDRFQTNQYSIRLQYSPEGALFALYPLLDEHQTIGNARKASTSMAIQAFHRESHRAHKLSFESPLLYQRFSAEKSSWGFNIAINDRILAVGNTITQVADIDSIGPCNPIHVVPYQILESAFHLDGSQIAILRQGDDKCVSLELYSFDRQLSNVDVYDDCASNPNFTTRPFTPALIVFDTANPPTFLILLIAQPDEKNGEPEDSSAYLSSPFRGPVQVWVFELPSLKEMKSFRLQRAGWISDTMIQADWAPRIRKLVCTESRKSHRWCRLWLIDVEKGTWNWQLFSRCRHLSYVKNEMIVTMTDGMIQCKSLAVMEKDIEQRGGGARGFEVVSSPWINWGWVRFAFIPYSFFPTRESELAVSDKGELAYVSEFGKRLIQLTFNWP